VPDLRYAAYLRPAVALDAAVAEVHDALRRRFGLVAAGRFMPHATLKGFFRTAAPPGELVERLAAALTPHGPVPVHNAGAVVLAPDTIALDIDTDWRGRQSARLRALHDAVFGALAPAVAADCDFTPVEYAGDRFRAHLTLAMADVAPARFADVLAAVRALEPIGPRESVATVVQLLRFESRDWAGAWWETLRWHEVHTVAL
jgi:2'-5' RNA ligase